MHWMLAGYMFLFIHRPFEVWPWLGDLRIERVYMGLTLAVWLIAPKRWLPNILHLGYAAFATTVLLCWVMSPWAERSQPLVEDWLKILVFYFLLVTTVYDEKGLKRVTVAFLTVMGVYLLHSFREYLAGRHTYRMGIPRLIGVDSSLGDPNSFGAGIVYALPFIAAFWKAGVGGRAGKFALTGYLGLSVLCILLTGSRSSLLGLALWAGLVLLRGNWKRAVIGGLALVVIAPAAYMALPESLQTRFETIVNPDAGPANAKESGEGRIQGFFTGLNLWAHNPISGVGPGAWRPATRSKVESHNMVGQLVGELGTLGLCGFLAVLAGIWLNLRRIAAIRRMMPEWQNDLVFQVATAVGTGVILLLFMGIFGHNLFRYSWLWYGGFLIISRYCIERRLKDLEYEQMMMANIEYDENDLPEGWEWHSGHADVAEPAVSG